MPYCHGKLPVTLNVQHDLPEFYILGNTNQLEQNQQVSGDVIDHVSRGDVAHSADLFESIQQFDGGTDD